jgi:hypothetical protein
MSSLLPAALVPAAHGIRPAVRSAVLARPAALAGSAVASAPPSAPSALPFTGADLAALLPLALSVLAAGAALVRTGRRRHPASTG